MNKPTLADKTTLYWAVARAKRTGKGPYAGLTTEKAIKTLRDLEDSLDGARNVAKRVTNLLDEIILGNGVDKEVNAANFVPIDATVKGKVSKADFQGKTASRIIIDPISLLTINVLIHLIRQ